MRHLVIHVGFGKTGTSAIQKALRVNARRLHEQGIYGCDLWLSKRSAGASGFSSPGEFGEALRSGGDALTDWLLAIFDGDNAAFGTAHTIIWSNEGLIMRWATMGEFISRLSARCRVTVVIYLRNQVDWLASGYLQWAIKDKQARGRIRTWEQYTQANARATDYAAVIQGWKTNAIGADVILRSYDAVPNVVEDFFSTIGIELEFEGINERVYETPEYTSLALFKILNDQYDEPREPEPLLRLLAEANVLNRDLHPVDPCPLNLAPEQLTALAATFSEANQRLREEYGVDLNASPKPLRVGKHRYSDATNTDLIAALLMLILWQERRIKALEMKMMTHNGQRSAKP